MDEKKLLKKKYDRAYYLKNREEICEKRRKHYIKTRTEYIRRNKTNYEKNKNKGSRVPILVAEGTLVKFD
jgi:hypothetical protein